VLHHYYAEGLKVNHPVFSAEELEKTPSFDRYSGKAKTMCSRPNNPKEAYQAL